MTPGQDTPPEWVGGLKIQYKFGPGFIDSSLKVTLEVNNEFVTKPAINVIGTIIGSEEPDRMVLVGNHRDAWVFGGVDPSSGTAVRVRVSLFDSWARKYPSTSEPGKPSFELLGAGSDYAPFCHFIGVPSIDLLRL